MKKIAATIEAHMTKSPQSIGVEQMLSQAHAVMREHRIRHLPVLHGGKLVGVLSQRDLHLIEALSDVDPTQVRVEEAMAGAPFAVAPDALLAEVVETMAEKKYGSAVVMKGEQVVGVFTTVDALRTLAALLGRGARG
jgi:acetoin utilization protein AcuB